MSSDLAERLTKKSAQVLVWRGRYYSPQTIWDWDDDMVISENVRSHAGSDDRNRKLDSLKTLHFSFVVICLRRDHFFVEN
jgi:hypothetical protein